MTPPWPWRREGGSYVSGGPPPRRRNARRERRASGEPAPTRHGSVAPAPQTIGERRACRAVHRQANQRQWAARLFGRPGSGPVLAISLLRTNEAKEPYVIRLQADPVGSAIGNAR